MRWPRWAASPTPTPATCRGLTGSAGELVDLRIFGAAYGGTGALASPMVELYTPSGVVLAPTGGNGSSYRTYSLPADGDYVVVARAVSSQTGGYYLLRVGGGNSGLRAIAAGAVFGQVRSQPGGAPALGQTVRLRQSGLVSAQSVSDDQGYRLAGFPPGAATVEAVTADGVVSATLGVTVPEPGQETRFDLDLPLRGLVRALVTRAGTPLPGLSVRLRSDHPTALSGDRERLRVTGADGLTPEVSLPVGLVTAFVTDPLSGAPHTGTAEVGPDGVTVVTVNLPDETARVFGTVYALDGVTPVAGASVTLAGEAGTTSGEQGRYELIGALAGARTLYVSYGSVWQSRQVTVVAPETALDLALPLRLARVTVTEADGTTPVLGAAVSACGPAGTWPFHTQCAGAATTGTDGLAILLDTPSWISYVTVTARHPEAWWLSASTLAYPSSQIVAALSLPASGTVSGTVLAGVDPVEGALVEIRNGDWVSPELRTDPAGAFSLSHVPVGQVRIYAEGPNGMPGGAEASLAAGGHETVTITLREPATLHGTRHGAGGPAEPGSVRIAVLDAPSRYPEQPWSLYLATETGSFDAVVPAGAWRALAYDDCSTGTAAADEGRLAPAGDGYATLQVGSHVCRSFGPSTEVVRIRPASAEAYPPYAAEQAGGALRSLRVLAGRLEARTEEHSPSGADWTRSLTFFTNPGDQPASAQVVLRLELQDTEREVAGSSSGDMGFDTQDGWVWLRDTLGSGEEQVLVLGDASHPDSVEFVPFEEGEGRTPGWLEARYTITVPPAETRAWLAFHLRRPVGEDPRALANDLMNLAVPEALAGLSPEEQQSIANFAAPVLHQVRGTVRADGAAVSGARVGLVASHRAIVDETLSDADGRFVLQAEDGIYSLVAVGLDPARPGRRPDPVAVNGADVDGADVDLLPASQLGVVTVRVTGNVPYEGALVTLTVDGFSDLWLAQASFGPDPELVFTGVPPGQVTATTSFGVATRTLAAGGSLTITFTAGTGSATVTGLVQETDGTPVSGARVALVGGDVILLETETGGDGRYTFSGVELGFFTLLATEPASNRPVVEPAFAEVLDSSPVEVVGLQLVPAAEVGTLRLVATHEAGAPVAGLPVLLRPERGCCEPLWPGQLQLGPDGTVEVRGVPSGGVVAEVGAVPDYGWAAGSVPALGTLVLPVSVGGGWVSLPHDLPTTDGLRYQAEGSGAVLLTPGEAWSVYVWPWTPASAARVSLGGRELEVANWVSPGVIHRRRVFVPAAGRFVRQYDSIENPGPVPLSLPRSWYQDIGADPAQPWAVGSTSSGDAVFDVGDTWAAFTSTAASLPEIAAVPRGLLPPVPFDDFGFGTGGGWLSWSAGFTSVTVPAHGRVAIVQFVVQLPHGQTAEAASLAAALADLSEPEALTGLTPEDRAAVVNFVLP